MLNLAVLKETLALTTNFNSFQSYNQLVSSNQESSTVSQGADSKADAVLMRILLVEDNDLNRHMLDDYLVFCGYQVLGIASGSEFFQALADFKPHLILLDLKLPGINGYALLEQIKQSTDWRHIPVLVVSAFAFRADKQRALNLGACRYFVKPVNLSELRQAIQEELYG